MARSNRLLAPFALVCFLSPTVLADQQACEAGDNGQSIEACSVADSTEVKPRLQKDHALFQLGRAVTVDVAKRRTVTAASQPVALSIVEYEGLADPAADANRSAALEDVGLRQATAQNVTSATARCHYWSVRRRRRNRHMCHCRRRHPTNNPWDLPSGMVCDGAKNRIVRASSRHAPSPPPPPPPAPPPPNNLPHGNWAPTGQFKGSGWCRVELPPQNWNLKNCPVSGNTPVKVLTYNLFWWNLFGRRKGNGRSAGRLIARSQGAGKFDLMAFQECDDMHRILKDAKSQGLSGDYELVNGQKALAIAFRRSSFRLISTGRADVGEDHRDQYYGLRSVHWVRLRHRSGKTLLFLNHHGPLPVSRGGGCTGAAAAWNILGVISTVAQPKDMVILTGDFNAEGWSSRIRALSSSMHRVFSGTRMGGVDHVFSNCQATNKVNLGRGGSDHDALTATFHI